jgi:hypothetical protein
MTRERFVKLLKTPQNWEEDSAFQKQIKIKRRRGGDAASPLHPRSLHPL